MGVLAVFMAVMLLAPAALAFFAELFWRRRRVVTALAIAAGPVLIYLLWMMWEAGRFSLDLQLIELAAYAYALALMGALVGTGLGMLVGWVWRRLAPLKD